MNLMDLIGRSPIPEPWGEGDNIPWNEPGFSGRMLAEHLTQDHDAASRRFEIIDEQVEWIDSSLLQNKPAKILDLGCGPGLYSSRLARRGHICSGIDFSPASVRHAREEAAAEGLACTYTEADIRTLEYGGLYDFGMLLYGEFNVFKPADAALILEKLHRSLKPGALLLLEPQDYASLQRCADQRATWRANRAGLFSPDPHLYLYENFWDGRSRSLTTRYWIVDAASAEVTRYAQTAQAYSDAELEALLNRQGFMEVKFFPALAPTEKQARQEFFGLTAVRK